MLLVLLGSGILVSTPCSHFEHGRIDAETLGIFLLAGVQMVRHSID